MRLLLLVLLAAAPVVTSLAQEKTLIDEDDTWNLYTRLDVNYSELGADSGYLGGVRVGGLLNERLGVGLAAYGLLQDLDAAPSGYKSLQSFDLFYGGAAADYHFISGRLFHLSVGALAGVGRLNVEAAGSRAKDEIRFNILEPQASAMLHLTPTIDIGLGVGYRWLSLARDVPGYDNDPFDGVVTTFFLRFTEF
jgi:hypothetical protein